MSIRVREWGIIIEQLTLTATPFIKKKLLLLLFLFFNNKTFKRGIFDIFIIIDQKNHNVFYLLTRYDFLFRFFFF